MGAGDPRKNLHSLILAYAELPIKLIVKHKLVLAGRMIPAEKELIFKWVDDCNLPRVYVHFLGYISDDDLCYLYRNCYLFVFPYSHLNKNILKN